jgi:hypothetical protein
VAVLAAAGVAAAYALARTLLPPARAVAGVLVTVALPGFALSTSSFMTDVPAFCADAVCLAAAAAALGRNGRARRGWLAVALAVGCFGFAVREFDIAAPLAALGALAVEDRRHRRAYALAAVALVVACAAIYFWSTQVPGAQDLPLALSGPVRLLKGLGHAFFTLALGLTPLLPTAVARSWDRLSARALLAAVAALAAGTLLLTGDHTLLAGNYLLPQGATGGAVLTGRPALFPGVVWWALELVALASGASLAAVAASVGRPAVPSGPRCGARLLLALFSTVTALFLVLFEGLTKGTVFDRYLWPLAFSTAVLLLARRRGPSRPVHARGTRARTASTGAHARDPSTPRRLPVVMATATLSTVVAAVAAVTTLNADAYDAARWSAGDRAVAAGVPARMVDAGFEWVGSHQRGTARPGRRVRSAPFYDTWYDQMFPAFSECAFVSGNLVALASLTRLATVTYQELGFAEPETLYVYAVHRPGCPLA